jgi:hypothetical protein
VKDGPIDAERAFALYGVTGIDAIDRALAQVITTPSIASKPYGFLRVEGGGGVEMQFVDVTRGLETHLLYEDEDDEGNTIRTLPDLILVTCHLNRRRENRLMDWTMLNGVRYVTFDGQEPYPFTQLHRTQA